MVSTKDIASELTVLVELDASQHEHLVSAPRAQVQIRFWLVVLPDSDMLCA